MLAELHLTEDAFALHLLLECPKGLVDIVVTDENLHVVFLLIQRLIGPMAKASGPLAYGSQTLPRLYSIRRLQGAKNCAS